MKKFCFLILISCTLINMAVAQTDEVLTNNKVVELYKKGLPSSIIVNKIKTSKNSFDVSSDALINLNEQKIPENIINAMFEAADNTTAINNTDPNNPLAPHESGIYYFNETGDKKELIMLEPTVCSQGKSGGYLGTALTYGIAKSKTKGVLDGRSARMQVENQNPVFYFYFDKNSSNLNASGSWYFANATSPNEFLLVKPEMKIKSREFVTGSMNSYGSSTGIDDKYRTDFTFEKIAQGIYKVSPKTDLSRGEYCFMYAGTVPSQYGGTSGQKVYDFGVK